MEGPGRWYIPQNRKDKPCKPSREIPVNVRGQNEPFPSGEGGGQVPSECYLELLEDEEGMGNKILHKKRIDMLLIYHNLLVNNQTVYRTVESTNIKSP